MEKYEKYIIIFLGLSIIGVIILAFLFPDPITPVEEESVGAPKTKELTQIQVNNIFSKQTELYQQYGNYVQFAEDGFVYEKGNKIVDVELEALLPDNVRMDVYTGPHGHGVILKEYRTVTREYFDYDLEQLVTGEVVEVREFNLGPDPNRGYDWKMTPQ